MATPLAPDTAAEIAVARGAIRTPRSAAIAGIVFALSLGTALVLVRLAVPSTAAETGAWLSDSTRRNAVLLALGLVPYAGIAFLWFMGVMRDRIGEMEDRFFSTVFLGSGLLFVGMLFVSAAMAVALVASTGKATAGPAETEVWEFGRYLTYTVLTIYAMRMAAVFMISTSTILLRTGVMPRWLALSGYGIAAVLLVAVGFFAWIELLFPAWVLVLSIYILVEGAPRSAT